MGITIVLWQKNKDTVKPIQYSVEPFKKINLFLPHMLFFSQCNWDSIWLSYINS